MKITAKKAAALLNSLGDTADEIKENLKGAGFKGRPDNGQECPCGACLREHLGIPEGSLGPHVGSLYVNFDGGVADLAPAMKDFVRKMDENAYPSLVKKA